MVLNPLPYFIFKNSTMFGIVAEYYCHRSLVIYISKMLNEINDALLN